MPPDQACRDAIKNLPLNRGQNAALLLSRYLKVPFKADGHNTGSDKTKPGARAILHQAASSAAANARDMYRMAFARWKQRVFDGHSRELTVKDRLMVGLGADNVLETGITLHHTYGVPYIPGSALKGLAAHYCNEVWGADDKNKEFRKFIVEKQTDGKEAKRTGDYFLILFGDQTAAGHIIFHDAWITPDSLQDDNKSGLAGDVMTPHHQKYYMEDAPPTDFDDPNPVTFLSVTGSFLVAVSCDVSGEQGDKWASRALDLLQEALREWGVGGKTSSGYGRLAESAPTSQPNDPSRTPAKPTPSGPQYAARAVLTVERVEDPKNKGRLWFKADDGLGGTIVGATPDTMPEVEIGQTIKLEVAAALDSGYNFRLPRG